MQKLKKLLMLMFLVSFLLIIPNISNAADVTIDREVQNTGNITFNFSGLDLDISKTYKWGITSTQAEIIETWYDLTDFTNTTATIKLSPTDSKIRSIINASDIGYISIKDSTDVVSLNQKVDLQIPYLLVTNYTQIDNGKQFSGTETINIALRNASCSKAYYQYQKITDKDVIDKYNKIKSSKGDYLDLLSNLPSTHPSSNWSSWKYWNGHDSFSTLGGYGYPVQKVAAPDNGLYLLWVYFSGTKGIKDLYGFILVDNLSGTSNTSSNDSTSDSTKTENGNKEQGSGRDTTVDTTIKSGILPYAGIGVGVTAIIILIVLCGMITYIKYNRIKDI